MSVAGLAVFDTTIQETNLWLKRLMEEMDTEDRHLAYAVLRATLQTLRDRIGPESAVHLGAQLPMLVRGFYYEGWRMSTTPTRERHLPAFLESVRGHLPAESVADVEDAVRCVLHVLWQKIDPGESAKLVRMMPLELRPLWPLGAQLG